MKKNVVPDLTKQQREPSKPSASEIPKPPPKRSRARGRPPRPPRCVVQLRRRVNGKVFSIFSMTVDCHTNEAMHRLQEAFKDVRGKFERSTDDPRWTSTPG